MRPCSASRSRRETSGNARSMVVARRARRERSAERLVGVAHETRPWTYRISPHRERRANGRANLPLGGEVDKASVGFRGRGLVKAGAAGERGADAAGRRAKGRPVRDAGRNGASTTEPRTPRRRTFRSGRLLQGPRAPARDVDGNRRTRCSRLACLRAVRDVPSGDVPAGARARRSPDEPRGSPPTPYQRKQTPLCVCRVVEARPRVEEWRDARFCTGLGFVGDVAFWDFDRAGG